MFLFSVLMFFLCACLAAWLLVFPVSREIVVQSIGAIGRRVGQRLRGSARERAQQAGRLARVAREAWRCSMAFLRRRYLLLLSTTVLLTLPPMLALVLSGQAMLEGYDSDSRAINNQVADLLKGEQLSVPLSLPPPVFTTVEVTLARPMLDSANRNWQLLDPEFSQRLLLVFKIMKERHGYDMAILEGYRSPQRQSALVAVGPGVTNAKAFQSYHQFGLAADCGFLRDGKLLISENDPWAMRGYKLYGEVAEAAGLHWGGRWTMMDLGHAELRLQRTLRK